MTEGPMTFDEGTKSGPSLRTVLLSWQVFGRPGRHRILVKAFGALGLLERCRHTIT
jgi:hypothetical protein